MENATAGPHKKKTRHISRVMPFEPLYGETVARPRYKKRPSNTPRQTAKDQLSNGDGASVGKKRPGALLQDDRASKVAKGMSWHHLCR